MDDRVEISSTYLSICLPVVSMLFSFVMSRPSEKTLTVHASNSCSCFCQAQRTIAVVLRRLPEAESLLSNPSWGTTALGCAVRARCSEERRRRDLSQSRISPLERCLCLTHLPPCVLSTATMRRLGT